ncbi:MAG TPA: tyrosine-type recombinase/integrase, partial [Terriglobales bacterium]|nr:tyrosine-type recombinase/integrase [Terriglobales bacterium]
GTKVKYWYGHYYVYVIDAEGVRTRVHRGVDLGEKSKVRKWEAEEKLRTICRGTKTGKPTSLTPFKTFTEDVFYSAKSGWSEITRARYKDMFEKQIFPAIGDKALGEITKDDCQKLFNQLAKDDFSFSVIDHCRTYIKAVFEEAIDQDLVAKNPVRKTEMPETRPTDKTVLPMELAGKLLEKLGLRDRLILGIATFCAMRPSEIFGLLWSSWQVDSFMISSTAVRGKLRMHKAKTKGSLASVAVPNWMLEELAAWKKECGDKAKQADALMFPSETGGPLWPENWIRRNVNPHLDGLSIDHINFQILRRSFATHAQKFSPHAKDVQTHLRHADITTTLDVYTQPVPESVRTLVNRVAEETMKKVVVQ